MAVGPDLRRRMCEAAAAVARTVGYTNVGTIEFLLAEDGSFYFLEMNTRLQVEHPITEMVTGVDLVRWQIRIARGERLDLDPAAMLVPLGHAIECCVYAEDPDAGFMPSPGRILGLRVPQGPGIRDDSGMYEGGEVPIFYDPMISKLIVCAEDRPAAVARMRRALGEYVVKGIKTSIPFHRTVLENARFLSGHFDTSFIDTEILTPDAALEQVDEEAQRVAIMLAAIAAFHRDRELAARAQPSTGTAAGSLWKAAGRSRQLRGVLR